ncbi:protein-tyrosine-phosphatase [Capsaspora owczarzaki ATCC 30864]|uniref:protein-tyrosine-phosphatase n=1 Tax=Capsaspora owczarzaki (strain ATCC 30864) TaxID=595528 RepID=A0A0D2X4W2_CAPO3|nr:protein-tyrosine-phosphatase [Capsaspora owczarzaki ATCC 30864]KJE96754.1 protein-tyrosine-phosphatase [Capsaspora owczarzaki ATCC 30864]|eukprot:XP_004343750.1 protein-tyrosine-phosphatase [Capsaspora owczarzaki ATCC 30864]
MATRKWFHPHLTGLEAEKTLKEKGFDGSFLVRPSKSNPGDFTLSVRRGTEITHVKIQNSGDFYDLYGGEKFATLSELVEYYMENQGQLREKNGSIINLRYPLLSEDPTNERWFHGNISGKDAETLLQSGADGSFLVRTSQSKPGDYCFSVRVTDKVTHVMIHNRKGRYDVGGGESFSDLTKLVNYYRENPMVETTGSIVTLKNPLNATKINVSSIKGRVTELEKETDEIYGKAGFWEEFEQLQQLESKNLYSRVEGQRPENKSKNRYKNILPFDHTRVVLQDVDHSEVGADYINANYISGEYPDLERAYIATQGPLPNTIDAFWLMIYEQHCQVVVNTTNETERGRTKCEHYWPDNADPKQYGHIIVSFKGEEVFPIYVKREFEIAHFMHGAPFRVQQFHYTSWPDHGVPKDPGAVLNYLRDVRQAQASFPRAGPIIVHCSAGIGRTGTFMMVDILMNNIQAKGIDCEVDIQRAIQQIRGQRSGLVQTEAQYKFVYLAIAHHIDTLRARILAEQQVKAVGAPSGQEALYGNIHGSHYENLGARKQPTGAGAQATNAMLPVGGWGALASKSGGPAAPTAAADNGEYANAEMLMRQNQWKPNAPAEPNYENIPGRKR